MSNIAWTLSGFGDEIHEDPAIQVAVLQSLGASHIEVRSAWGVNVADFTDAHLGQLKDVLDETGMAVSAIASPIGKVDIDLPVSHEVERLRRICQIATTLDTEYVRIFSFFYGDKSHESIRDAVMERLQALAAVAEEYGLTLLHENEKDIYGDTPERVLDLIQTVDSPALRVAWDNANFVQVGVDHPFDAGYDLLKPYLEYLQVKDALTATGEVVPVGKGDGQLLETLRALRDDGFDGFASLEPHLSEGFALGGFSGPFAFGVAARALRDLTSQLDIDLI